MSLAQAAELPLWRQPIALLVLMAIAMPISFSTWSALLNNWVIEHVSFGGAEIGWLHTIREVPGLLAVGVIALIVFIREQLLGLIMLILLGVATALTATQLPEVARTPGITLSLDVQATAASLRDSRDRLTAALAAVAREVREAQSTRSARDEAMARYDRVFRSYASMLVMLFELAGKPDLADHVRPSTRRPGQTRDAAAGRDVSLDEVLRTDDAEGENATPPTATA